MMEWPVLFLTGVLAGGVDSIAGGGGLITLPVLLNLGLPPRVALGTNKLQAVFGSGSATLHYGRAGAIEYRASLAGVGFTAIGAATDRGMSPGGGSCHEFPHLAHRTVRPLGMRAPGSTEYRVSQDGQVRIMRAVRP